MINLAECRNDEFFPIGGNSTDFLSSEIKDSSNSRYAMLMGNRSKYLNQSLGATFKDYHLSGLMYALEQGDIG